MCLHQDSVNEMHDLNAAHVCGSSNEFMFFINDSYGDSEKHVCVLIESNDQPMIVSSELEVEVGDVDGSNAVFFETIL